MAAEPLRPVDLDARPSLGKRASRTLARFLITFCIGVAATLAWQSYGDAARQMIANSYPPLGWLAPQSAPVAQTAPNMVAPRTSHCVRAVSAFPSEADLIGVMVVSDHRPGGALEPRRRQCERQV